MPTLRLFATIRVAAGVGKAEIEGETVAAVLDNATVAYGAGFAELIPTCRIWVNGEAAQPETAVSAGDEVALLPPVSGG
jgi:MoaD family protein